MQENTRVMPRVHLQPSAFLLHLRQLFHQRQHHFHDIAPAMLDPSRQRVVDILLIIQLHVMPADALWEAARFAPLLIAIFLA